MTAARTRLLVAGSLLALAALLALRFRGAETHDARPGAKASSGGRVAGTEAGVTRAPEPAERSVAPATAATENDFEDSKAELELSRRPDPQHLTRLAATSDDPEVVASAFAAILSTYASRSTRKPGPDADLERAIVKHVSSERASSARAALDAARIPLMTATPSETVTRAIAALAAPEHATARRYAALEALNLIRPNQRDETVLRAFEGALVATEPHLLAIALVALSQSRASVEAAPEPLRRRLAERVLALLDHHDPGVRGQALLVLSEIPALETAATRYQAALKVSRDRDPYVRARAADLFARLRDPAAIHVLIEHVRDLSPARYEMRGWVDLDGAPGLLVCELPGRKRVAEAALFALVVLGETLGEASRLLLTLGGRPGSDAAVLENAEIARAWYAAQKPRVPKEPVTTPASQ